jgi:hypothetical protein
MLLQRGSASGRDSGKQLWKCSGSEKVSAVLSLELGCNGWNWAAAVGRFQGASRGFRKADKVRVLAGSFVAHVTWLCIFFAHRQIISDAWDTFSSTFGKPSKHPSPHAKRIAFSTSRYYRVSVGDDLTSYKKCKKFSTQQITTLAGNDRKSELLIFCNGDWG